MTMSVTPKSLRIEAAGLVLVPRAGGRTAWAFTERAVGAPPVASMCEPLKVLEAVGRVVGADPERYWWWLKDEALDEIGRRLSTSNYAVIDGLLGEKAARRFRREVEKLRSAGRLQLSKLAGGRSGANLTYSHTAVRGDLVGWFDGEESDLWPRRSLASYLTKVDTLVAQLGSRLEQLGAIASRSKAMVACYPGGGARYVRHCDNSCDSGHGERCNGRRLTAVFYLNEGWAPLQGGELRLYAPYAPKGVAPLCDVPPVGDRLVLFFSDYRVPHEVLAAHAERFAVTTWYFDRAEHTRARGQGVAAEQTDALESDAIEREIARFEERFGAGAVVHGVAQDQAPALAAG